MIRVLFLSFLFLFYGSYEAFGIEKVSRKNAVISSVSQTKEEKTLANPQKDSSKKTICLNMIVKDESPVIKRCLSSVKKFIDYWVIVDTGSTDGTQEIIKDFMKDIPGKLYERPWKNFGHNRNEALQLAKGCGDYVLFIDADEIFLAPEGYAFPSLEEDGYLIAVQTLESDEMQFNRWFLMNNHLDLFWKGVIHEQLDCSIAISGNVLPGIVISAASKDGHRSQDPNKFLKDAKVLEEALKLEPDNSTYVHYLAQSYFLAKEYPLALKYYLQRTTMGGWDEEIYWSKYRAALLQEMLQMQDQCIQSYCEAYRYRPSRAEPLYSLAKRFFEKEDYLISYALAKYAMTLPVPQDRIYVEKWKYDFGMLYYLAYSAIKIGKTEEAIESLEKMLLCKNLPDHIRRETKSNLTQLRTNLFLQKK